MARYTQAVLALIAVAAVVPSTTWAKNSKPWLAGDGSPAISTAQQAQSARDVASASKLGYLDRSTVIAPPAEMLQNIQSEEARLASARGNVMRRFFPLNPVLERRAAASVKPVPADLLSAGAPNYISMSSERTLRLYTGTALGTVLVKEVVGARLQAVMARPPDAVIGGVPVFIATVRYAGGTWMTEAIANPPGKVVHVFFGTRVDSPARSAAVRSWLQAVLGT
jgi:hypothetical protein